jgi:hypothetical protein
MSQIVKEVIFLGNKVLVESIKAARHEIVVRDFLVEKSIRFRISIFLIECRCHLRLPVPL